MQRSMTRLREIFCPTGDWIKADAEIQRQEQLMREKEQKDKEDQEAAERQLEEDQRREEIRRKKKQLGLDPEKGMYTTNACIMYSLRAVNHPTARLLSSHQWILGIL